ncbi:alkaline phosphatase PhoX [Glycomyces terrestris]|uniref:alkaline phosphatase PhoX n=1 Tax=Glycomyces terrestris TaxID=2493553 RepID=UPI0018D4F1E9|nr:alkaline phosphatase PhoX [Glycomyces terrestris]
MTLQGSNRRSFLRRGAAAAGGGFASSAVEGLAVRAARAEDGRRARTAPGNGGYGPLRELTRLDPASGFSQTLRLPEGFDFAVCSVAGAPLADGSATPPAHGGLACFPTGRRGEWRLVRGHGAVGVPDAAPEDAKHRYDPLASGGTTTLAVSWKDGEFALEAARRSLSGAVATRSGGPTPWGSWLACEESAAGTAAGWEAPHGYVFEVPSAADEESEPLPLKELGRFVHAGAAVDPRTGAVYLTEDQHSAGFYRFVPDAPGRLAEGGRLQMLKFAGEWNADARSGRRAGRSVYVEWVDIDDPDPAGAEADPYAVFDQGWARGAAVFGRLQGCFAADGAVYAASVSGGDEGEGQLWELRPRGLRGGTLKLVFESPDAALLPFPEAIAPSPAGSLVLCEGTGREAPVLRGLTREGEVFDLAGHDGAAVWSGAAFSPDGAVLFANLRGSARGDRAEPGRTVAIWGPWRKGVL